MFALALLTLALLLFWQMDKKRYQAGLPGGRVIYTDTRGWGTVDKPLHDRKLRLTGKPDYLVERGSYGIIHYGGHYFAVDCSHQSAARCRGCGYRQICDQRLA